MKTVACDSGVYLASQHESVNDINDARLNGIDRFSLLGERRIFGLDRLSQATTDRLS